MHTNCFTVDFEDWYQGIELPISEWENHERRIEHGFNKVMELLDKHQCPRTPKAFRTL